MSKQQLQFDDPEIPAHCLQCGIMFNAMPVFYEKSVSLYEDFCSDECIDEYNRINKTDIKKA